MDGEELSAAESAATLAGWPQRLARDVESGRQGGDIAAMACTSVTESRGDDAATAAAAAEAARKASLPRLYRQSRQDAAAGPSQASVAERLQRMRLEDRRRARNAQLREEASKGRQGSSSLRADAPAFHPITTTASLAGSASARAGALFIAANKLSQQDKVDDQRNRALRRKFAGPAPPSSWQQRSEESRSVANEEEAAPQRPPIDRWHSLRAARHFFPDKYGRAKTDATPARTPPLTDLALCVILKCLNDEDGERAAHTALRSRVYALPIHLRERALALAGRYARSAPLSSAALWRLLADDGEEERPGDDSMTQCAQNDSVGEEEDDQLNDLPDAWDAESERAVGYGDQAHTACVNVDLSFASVSGIFLRALIKSPNVDASGIRALSLAGWGYGADATQGRTRKCLRTSASLLSVLDQLPNLQVLSLAHSRLLPDGDDEVANLGSDGKDDNAAYYLDADAASEATAFLRKLSRRTARLVTLDLSGCRWVDGAAMANAGWHSTSVPVRRLAWLHLQHLVLTDCPAFSAADGAAATPLAPLRESGNYAASWHAAHHGLPRATASPYFLTHKPGLGRALLAHGVGAWDFASGRGNLIGREAAALARHSGLQLQHLHAATPHSAFDDVGHVGAAPAFVGGGGYAVSHGVAPFAARRAARQGGTTSTTTPSTNSHEPPRCPVSKERVPPHEWNRARVLDAVRGRWGSAILGTFVDADPTIATIVSQSTGGAFVTVYF